MSWLNHPASGLLARALCLLSYCRSRHPTRHFKCNSSRQAQQQQQRWQQTMLMLVSDQVQLDPADTCWPLFVVSVATAVLPVAVSPAAVAAGAAVAIVSAGSSRRLSKLPAAVLLQRGAAAPATAAKKGSAPVQQQPQPCCSSDGSSVSLVDTASAGSVSDSQLAPARIPPEAVAGAVANSCTQQHAAAAAHPASL